MSEKKEEYLFDKYYEQQFKSVLQNQSLAVSFWSDKSAKPIFTDRAKTTNTTSIKKGMRIVFYKSLLPRHCDGNLVAEALSFLEAYPEEIELLKNIAGYIRNDLFEYIGYWGVLVGSIGSCCLGSVFCAVIVIYPFIFHPYLGVFSFCIISISTTIFILNVFYDDALGLKFGRWIAELVEGIHLNPVNSEELIKKIMTCIYGEKIEEVVEQRSNEDSKSIHLEDLKRKLMTRIQSDVGKTIEEALEELVNESSKTIHLEDLKRKLMTRMHPDEVEKAIEAIEEAIEALSNEERYSYTIG
ncbi:hypothetical protein [Rickettsiella endosymbiont of Dermanyssus gallinae]|uniref:hypothetical protein n=1 Tax=Rickettsiella endosymbiont of Dermanyssus gallinae TaxID=2856608 RepID=UPI001C52A17A|nr:hypothetical protein [Rickettsiella endosymbiont of Dermanyssus gallinae]